jgi:thiol-disulfide isomerase/thioredoxin
MKPTGKTTDRLSHLLKDTIMQRRSLLNLAAGGAASAAGLIWTPDAAAADLAKAPEVGARMPKLVGKTVDQREFRLGLGKDRMALVAFWATWCPKCRVEMPLFRAAHEKYFAKGFDLVTVSIDRNLDDVVTYDRVVEKTVPVTQRFAQLWRGAAGHEDGFGPVVSTPTVYLINRKQRVAAIFKGRLTDSDWARIEREIRGA